MSRRTTNGRFQKGKSGNPGGRPKLPAEIREMFQAKAPEAFEVLCRHLNAKDPRIAVAAATQILDRAYGRPAQVIDANITDGDGPVRYYVELPKKAESPEAWLQSLGRGQALPTRTGLTGDSEGDADDEQRH